LTPLTTKFPSEAQIAQEETYANIGRAMRNADCLATLGEVWKLQQPGLKTLSPEWQRELTEEKDRLKVQFLDMSRGVTA
jgi:hypothetical protein